LIVFENSFSVVSGIIELFRNGQYPLFIVVLGFSVILPLIKIAILYLLLSRRGSNNQQIGRYIDLMHEYGRWAMLDVMVVAVLVVTVKLGAVASIKVHAGLYVFGAAVLMIMYITHRVKLSK
jgi:paraquat-inducible protein A